ncbi:MAG: DNA-binding protein [Bacteroidetes bacterium GWC2_33_15]|nr:MAG: DNA-binding protein [Bacteroidetes bacterium GWA2_33_15]OFX51111.1 MAG: DNA-binding protein [Bacteroidetes bacterium GWC2_33_15]OFX66455.1 MAG: DNA-binding protein [Bacteroidetes bacterium GWB2_32_14]OFX70319.1 MAG: DNA-binding protein [Bacteroidetes bacterium GWD2_33_33]HAN17321.1 DNA-binding protein [Bacteroidales bacterium]
MDGYEKHDEIENNGREEIFSKVVRAGKRTYFLDVKATKRNDYYLTITESKKRFNRDGRHYFEKHKIFLYKEDFEKFIENLTEAIDFIKVNVPEILPLEHAEVGVEAENNNGYTSDVEFDDLGEKN